MSIGTHNDENILFSLTFTYPIFDDPLTKKGYYRRTLDCRFDILGNFYDISEFIRGNSNPDPGSYEYTVTINLKQGRYLSTMYFRNDEDYGYVKDKFTEFLRKDANVPFKVVNFDGKETLQSEQYVRHISSLATQSLRGDHQGIHTSHYPERGNMREDFVQYPIKRSHTGDIKPFIAGGGSHGKFVGW